MAKQVNNKLVSRRCKVHTWAREVERSRSRSRSTGVCVTRVGLKAPLPSDFCIHCGESRFMVEALVSAVVSEVG